MWKKQQYILYIVFTVHEPIVGLQLRARKLTYLHQVLHVQTEEMSDTKTANITEQQRLDMFPGYVLPLFLLLSVADAWEHVGFLSPEETQISDNIIDKSEEEGVWGLKWTVMSARAQSEEAMRALLSFLLQRSSSEPCLVFSRLLSLARSSWNITGKSHSCWVNPNSPKQVR